ncbi:MAG: type II secretion system minor pseudopilin GspK [Steroidobacterales bacterium]
MNGRAQGPQRQRGVALIIALVLVALATILAWKISFQGYLERRRTIGFVAAEQAMHFGLGAEALAADILARDFQQSKQDTLADEWAQPSQALPITSQDNPDGEPIGTLQGGLEDMQGRFNLNNLGRIIVQNGKPIQDPQPLEQFQRLLAALQLEPKWAAIARDWIDADSNPGEPDGAEDAVYTSQTPPYLTGNWPMTSTSELLALPGFGAQRYQKLAPYVTALPTANATINVCTASPFVLESLGQNLSGEWSTNPDAMVVGRKSGCFPDINTFKSVAGTANASKIAALITDRSQYFMLTTHVTLGTSEFTLYSLLQRGSGGKVTPLLRTFGTL